MTKGLVFSGIRGRLKETGQTTTYHIGDDGDYERGLSQVYTVYTAGQYAGSVTVDVAHYAAATISFDDAGPTIADSANLLATFLTLDTIVVKGSASNDGVYTIHAGANAASFVTHEAVVDEAAGRYITIYKRITFPNACVWDRRTGLMWARNTTNALKVGPASTGLLNWYDATTCFTLHPAAADLQIIAAPSNILRIVGGAGEVTRYHVGDLLDLTGFATAVNNIPGYRVLSVTVNGADLDIVLDPVKSVLVAEAAGGSRSIMLVCRSCFTFCAAANAALVGGYSDWRIPNDSSLVALRTMETPNAAPNPVAFPAWTFIAVHSSTTRPTLTTQGVLVNFNHGSIGGLLKTDIVNAVAALARGGTL